jgi:hypothetical protein
MAKMQRVPQRASLIYKTAFLLLKRRGHNLRASHQIPDGWMKGEKQLAVVNDDRILLDLQGGNQSSAAGTSQIKRNGSIAGTPLKA